jgi:cystathionine beta-lyase/cystathionine gamma-synthase
MFAMARARGGGGVLRGLTRPFSGLDPSAATVAIHAGEQQLDERTHASAPSLCLSTTFSVQEPLSFSANALAESDPWCYTRWANPTVRQLEHKLAALEGVAAGNAVAFASGMAASAATLFSLLESGDHCVVSDTQYPGVAELFRDTLPRFGVESTAVNASDPRNVEAAIIPGRTKLVWIETPANPILRLTDISAVADIAHGAGVELVVDSTFATPVITQPIVDHDADFVVHSLSKYLCGHGDAIGGAVVGKSAERVQRLRTEGAIHHGGVLSPFNAFLINRGIATLPMRMHAHSQGATRVAQWLESQVGSSRSLVSHVTFPFLKSHPQHALAKRQMKMASGMVSFQVEAGREEEVAARFMKELETIHYAVSLGHHRSLVYLLSTVDLAEREGSSYALEGEQLDEYRAYAGNGVFRFSVGLEDPEDLIEDLSRVLCC